MMQMELNFGTVPGAGELGATWVHRFTKNALCIETERWSFSFGLWGHLHGTWVTERRTGIAHEIVHDWQPLNRIGTYRADKRPRNEGDFYPLPRHWMAWCEISSAFVAYFNQIPARFRRVVGQLKGHQWLALDLIWQVPEFAWFLDEEIASGRRHYFHACAELAGAEQMSRRSRKEFAHFIMSAKRSVVLGKLTSIQLSKRSHRLLNKIEDEEVWDAEWYRELFMVSVTPSGSKAFSHAGSIDFYGIMHWNFLPPKLQLTNLLRLLVSNTSVADQFVYEIQDPLKLLPEGVLERVRTSLSNVTDHHSLACWPDNHLENFLASLPFPQSPIPGTEDLTPLDSASLMIEEARKMQNCLESDIWGVRSGARYYFHWNGTEDATVLLEKNDEDEWYFSEMLGTENDDVPRQTRLYVEALVDSQLSNQNPDIKSLVLLNGTLLANDNIPAPISPPPEHALDYVAFGFASEEPSLPSLHNLEGNLEAPPKAAPTAKTTETDTGDCAPCLAL